MDPEDVVTQETLARVRAITAREARRVLIVAALAAPAGGAAILAVVYAVYGFLDLRLASVVLAVFALIGIHQVVHWARHYRSISRQLDALEARVTQGELIYGSQVRFQSYR